MGTKRQNRQERLLAVLDRLAERIPNGALLLAGDGADLLDAATDQLVALERERDEAIAALEEALNRIPPRQADLEERLAQLKENRR